jgi:predicted N-acyltransferase
MKLEAFVAESIDEIEASAWDLCAGEFLFARHGFLKALEQSGTVGASRSVLPRYLGLRDPAGRLVACAPAMLKWGSKREFGPEIQWLRAGSRAACFAWPKLQVGTPFYPVMGPRLLTHPDYAAPALRTALVQCLQKLARQQTGLSVFNIMHTSPELAGQWAGTGALTSHEMRSVWYNPGHASFADFVASLPERKRHKISRERRRVQQLGLQFRALRGDEITPGLLAQYYEGYARVCARYGGKPWLPASMFEQLRLHLPESMLLLAAFDGAEYVAGVFCLHNSTTLFSQTWSAMRFYPDLCFEMICYWPMAYAIEHGLSCIDAGLAGKHKTIRCFLEEPVLNVHWFFNQQLKELAQAVLAASATGTTEERDVPGLNDV